MTQTLELPNDIKKCHELINELVVCSEQLKGDNELLKLSVKELKAMLKLANYKLYGESSEKSKHFDEYLNKKFEQLKKDKSSFQLELFADIEADYKAYLEAQNMKASLSDIEKPKKEPKKKYKKRLTETEDLPIEECHHNAEVGICSKCQKADFSELASEVTRELEIKPAVVYIKEHITHKVVCNSCGDITRGDKPLPPLNKCCAGAGLLSHIAYSRFDLYLPYYRLSKDFKNLGVIISEANLCNWMGNLASDIFTPLYEALIRLVLKTNNLYCDETVIKEMAKGKCILKYLWAYTNGEANVVVFDYSSRNRENPSLFLKDYKNGNLITDKYGGYDEICRINNLNRGYCWVHARRKFRDILKGSSDINELVVIREIEGLITKMLNTDAAIRAEFFGDERVQKRAELAEPLIDVIYEKLDRLYKFAKLGFSKQLQNAVYYTISAKEEFKLFLKHPGMEPTNNISERNVRFVTIGRKNWMFTGSPKGGRTLAVIASIIASAKMNKLNVREYLEDVIRRLPNMKMSEIDTLLPPNYKKNLPQS